MILSKFKIKILAYEDEKGKWNLKTIPEIYPTYKTVKIYLNENTYQNQELWNVVIDIGEFICCDTLEEYDLKIYLRNFGEDINV